MANNTVHLYQYLISDYSVGNMYLVSGLTEAEARAKLRDKIVELDKKAWEDDGTTLWCEASRCKINEADDILTAPLHDIEASFWDINLYDMSTHMEMPTDTVADDYVVHICAASGWGSDWKTVLEHYPHDDLIFVYDGDDGYDGWSTECFIVGRSLQSIVESIAYPDLILEREPGETIHTYTKYDARITIYDDYVE